MTLANAISAVIALIIGLALAGWAYHYWEEDEL